jgi:Zn-dependent protease with chaperone function
VTTTALVLLAAVLAGPAPAVLARTTAVRRAPRAALVLWQAVALAAVLAALGAGLSLATVPDLSPGVAVLAVVVTLTVLGRLLLSGHLVGTRVRSLRRRHRQMVDLLGSEDAGVRVLAHTAPMVYCVPAVTGSRVVVTAGARERLDDDALAAVLAHERAHLRARHDLVVEAFTVLHDAFPRFVTSRAALAEVRLLVEVLADRAARRRLGPAPLVRALAALVGSTVPPAALAVAGAGADGGADGGELAARMVLLRDERPHRVLAAGLYAGAVAVLVLPTVFVAVPWLLTVV